MPAAGLCFCHPWNAKPLELLLQCIAARSEGLLEPELSGVLPWDAYEQWQVLGLTADPGVLEVNLPVCQQLA